MHPAYQNRIVLPCNDLGVTVVEGRCPLPVTVRHLNDLRSAPPARCS